MLTGVSKSTLEVKAAAEARAREMGHKMINSGHLLLGILATDSIAAAVLQANGVSLGLVWGLMEHWLGFGEELSQPDLNGLFEDAARIAREEGDILVEPEHLLLAMVRDFQEEGRGVSSKIFNEINFGLSYREAKEWLFGIPR